MYITISQKPSKEEIAMFNMKAIEEDSIIDYRIELASLDKEVKKALCEQYKLMPERVESVTRVTLSYDQDV